MIDLTWLEHLMWNLEISEEPKRLYSQVMSNWVTIQGTGTRSFIRYFTRTHPCGKGLLRWRGGKKKGDKKNPAKNEVSVVQSHRITIVAYFHKISDVVQICETCEELVLGKKTCLWRCLRMLSEYLLLKAQGGLFIKSIGWKKIYKQICRSHEHLLSSKNEQESSFWAANQRH